MGSQTDKSGMSGQWSSEEIKEVQQALKEKGHDPGEIDGVMSSQTQQAIRAFQQKNGLQATGTLNAETAAALGVSSPGAGGKSSSGRSGESSSGTSGKSSTGESGKGSYGSSGSGSSK
ncbi:MAG: peptidoglycan-binding domain-containing protein [Candidatus Binatia bacterium]